MPVAHSGQAANARAVLHARPEHIPTLNGVRGIAALSAMSMHSPSPIGQDGWLGTVAMDMFFVLSGFLIGRLLLVDRDAGHPVSRFYIRRVARIFPAYYIMLLAVGLAVGLRGVGWAIPYFTSLVLPFNKQSVHLWVMHTWSLSVEELFYAAAPLVVYSVTRERLGVVLQWAIGAGVLFVLTEPTWGMVAPMTLYHFPLSRVPALAIGVTLALHESKLRETTSRNWWTVFTLFVGGLGASGMTGFGQQAPEAIRTLLIGAAAVLAALNCHWTDSSFGRVFTFPLFAWPGVISYGLYLYYFPIRYALADRGLDPGTELIAGFVITFAVAIASWALVERPIQQWARGRRFILTSAAPGTSPTAG